MTKQITYKFVKLNRGSYFECLDTFIVVKYSTFFILTNHYRTWRINSDIIANRHGKLK